MDTTIKPTGTLDTIPQAVATVKGPLNPITVPKAGSVVTDTQGRAGVAAYNPNNGTKLPSSTVLTNANIIENTIPDNTKKLDDLSNKGTILGPDGLERYSDGSLVTNTVKDSKGNNYTTDNNGQIISGPSNGDYKIGSNTSEYEGDNPSLQTPDSLYKQQMGMLDEMKTNLDANTKSAIDNLQQKFATREQQLQDINSRDQASTRTSLLNSGSSRYAQVSSKGLISEVERKGISDLAALDAQENDAINAAKTAQSNGEYKIMDEKLSLINDLRKQKTDAAQKLNDTATAQNKIIQDKQIQASRDSAIAGLLEQGVTDPKQILDYLNQNEQGNSTGDFTADEVAKTLKSLADTNADGDITKLTGNIKDFYILQKNGTLPSSIAGLPEGEQLKAWLDYIKPTKSVGVGTVNKITLSEAKAQGLPLSVVGMSENDVANSFDDPTPPQWFVEKAQSEEGSVLAPTAINTQWTTYRQAYIKARGTGKASSSSSSSGSRSI